MFNQIASTDNLLIFLLECLQVKGLPFVSSSMHSFISTNQYNWGHVAMFASSSESSGLQISFHPFSLLPPFLRAHHSRCLWFSGSLWLWLSSFRKWTPQGVNRIIRPFSLFNKHITGAPSSAKNRFGDTPELSFLPELGEAATRRACRTSWYQCPP